MNAAKWIARLLRRNEMEAGVPRSSSQAGS